MQLLQSGKIIISERGVTENHDNRPRANFCSSSILLVEEGCGKEGFLSRDPPLVPKASSLFKCQLTPGFASAFSQEEPFPKSHAGYRTSNSYIVMIVFLMLLL